MTALEKIIPEKNIVIFSPHFDDVLFMLGGYVNELKKSNLLHSKAIHIIIVFSRSNYLAGTGAGNFDNSLDRVKLATGKRLLEDQHCNDELFGRFNYTYQLLGEDECFARGKAFADSEMEFPHGMFENFDENDRAIFSRMQGVIERYAGLTDTALIFPVAYKEHVDHFIVREAAIAVAKKRDAGATFYFHEDKPYGGIASELELARVSEFVRLHGLTARTYACDAGEVIRLAFSHYVSQVEEVYKTGILRRATVLQQEMGVEVGCDRVYVLER
jgi:hypothetical protein